MLRKRTLWIAVCALALLVGCGGGPEDDRGDARESDLSDDRGTGEVGRENLLEIPEIALERLEPDVAQALEQRLEKLKGLVADASLEAEKLGQAIGTTGMILHSHDLFDQAEACYMNARALSPEDFRWVYYLGKLHESKGRTDTAIGFLEQALRLKPDAVPAQITLAQRLIEVGRFAEGEQLLRQVLEREPSTAIAHFHLGQAAMARGDHVGAVQRFTRTLELQPEATRVQISLSYAYRALGDEQQADRHLALRGDGALRFDDRWMKKVQRLTRGRHLLLEAGTTAFAQGDFETAANNFRGVVEEDPENASAWLNLGAALFRMRRAEEAREAFERALSLDESQPMAHRNLGTLLAAEGKLEPAIEHYRKALEANPSDATTRFNLANALRRVRRYPEALVGFHKVIELDPANTAAHFAAAICNVHLGDHRAALNDLETAMAAFPENLMLANAAARLLAAAPEEGLRDGRRALEIARRVVGKNGSLPFLETLAMAHAEVGEFEQAIEVQRGALGAAFEANRSDLLPFVRENLAAYEQGRPCRKPWPDE